MWIDMLAVAVGVTVNVAVLWLTILRGLHQSLTVSIVVTGGVTAILFAALPVLAPLPAWTTLVVWAMLAIGLYNAPAQETPDDTDLLDAFFGDDGS